MSASGESIREPAASVAVRAEALANRLSADRTKRRRMMVIVNPHATTVSDNLRRLIMYALSSRYEVEEVQTEAREHATSLCRQAASEGYDLIAAFGGDGTVNEAANGLAGSATPLAILPGGATNVFCRLLGIPSDVIDATETLLGAADRFAARRIDLGLVEGRHFTFSAGIGLDADVVERVDRHPTLKARLGPWYYAYATAATFGRRYLRGGPRLTVAVAGEQVPAATVVVQNCDPYTYFGGRPIRINEAPSLDDGRIGLTTLRRTRPQELPTVAARALTGRASAVAGHRQVRGFPSITAATVHAPPGTTAPVQVDGDYIGDFERVRFGVAPGALGVVA